MVPDRIDPNAPQLEDPWRHKSKGMRCSTCMYYVPKDTSELGRCRRRSPTLDGWPVVYPIDWCGDHKLAAAVKP